MISFPTIDESWTLFLDRDGVLNKKREADWVKKWAEFEWIAGVLTSLKFLNATFGVIIVVTNQRGISLDLFNQDDLKQIMDRMKAEISTFGGRIDAYYFCPHAKEAQCACRKPQIGMGQQAQRDFSSIDFDKALMVGDQESDMLFGRSLGMKTIFLNNNTDAIKTSVADFCFKNLEEFCEFLKENV